MSAGNILVTGSNGGLGLYVVEYLLKKNIRNILCHYRTSSEKIESLLMKYDLPLENHLIQANLSDEQSVSQMKSNLEIKGIEVHKIVNVAGASSNGMSWKISGEEFKTVVNDNLLSTFLTCKAFIPKMRELGHGRIINFSSIVGFTGVAGAAHYSAAKAGIIGLTKSLALELASKNITCNALALGYFDTGLINDIPLEVQKDIAKKIPLGRFGTENDVGSLVYFMLSEDSGFITGQVIHINGGQL